MRYPLTLYALEPTITSFDDAIAPKALESEAMSSFPIDDGFDFDAKLYVLAVEPKLPSWASLLADGFPDYQPDPSAMPRVALILRVDLDDEHSRYFAATFGSGRYLLRRHSYQPGYGLKVALNSIYEGDSREDPLPPDRLRAIRSTTVAKNTIRRFHQANDDAAFQEFGVDLQRDQLGQVVGAPRSDRWGARITGADSVRLQVVEHLGDLGHLCEDLIALHDEDDFEVRFGAIDDIRTVPDADVPALEARVLDLLVESPDQVRVAPADLLDWDRVAEFRLTLSGERFEEVSLVDVLAAAEASDRDLTLDLLKEEQIECLDDEGKVLDRWSLFESLDAELRDGEETVLLVAGRFYDVAQDYLDELHDYLKTIDPADVTLPDSTSTFVMKDGKRKQVEETEGDYNERAADERDELVLLDKKTVRLERGGDPIEICDLFSLDRQLIHVKRKFGSSSLSHLFAQGSVSGDLLLMNEEFRHRFIESVAGTPCEGLVPEERPDTSTFEVVYAIIGRWKGQSLAERLPFFSKINLRSHTQTLRGLGFRVSYAPIELRDPV